jgi:hypothetical protein
MKKILRSNPHTHQLKSANLFLPAAINEISISYKSRKEQSKVSGTPSNQESIATEENQVQVKLPQIKSNLLR